MNKKMMIIMLITILSVIFTACSGNKAPTVESKLSAKEMADQMFAEVEQPQLMELTAEDVQTIYNIDVAKLEDYQIRIPLMIVHANELAIVKVKDAKDIAEIEAAFKARAEAAQKSFEQYLPDQYENAKNYKLVTKGNYVIMVISDKADELMKVYEGFFEQK